MGSSWIFTTLVLLSLALAPTASVAAEACDPSIAVREALSDFIIKRDQQATLDPILSALDKPVRGYRRKGLSKMMDANGQGLPTIYVRSRDLARKFGRSKIETETAKREISGLLAEHRRYPKVKEAYLKTAANLKAEREWLTRLKDDFKKRGLSHGEVDVPPQFSKSANLAPTETKIVGEVADLSQADFERYRGQYQTLKELYQSQKDLLEHALKQPDLDRGLYLPFPKNRNGIFDDSGLPEYALVHFDDRTQLERALDYAQRRTESYNSLITHLEQVRANPEMKQFTIRLPEPETRVERIAFESLKDLDNQISRVDQQIRDIMGSDFDKGTVSWTRVPGELDALEARQAEVHTSLDHVSRTFAQKTRAWTPEGRQTAPEWAKVEEEIKQSLANRENLPSPQGFRELLTREFREEWKELKRNSNRKELGVVFQKTRRIATLVDATRKALYGLFSIPFVTPALSWVDDKTDEAISDLFRSRETKEKNCISKVDITAYAHCQAKLVQEYTGKILAYQFHLNERRQKLFHGDAQPTAAEQELLAKTGYQAAMDLALVNRAATLEADHEITQEIGRLAKQGRLSDGQIMALEKHASRFLSDTSEKVHGLPYSEGQLYALNLIAQSRKKIRTFIKRL